MTDIAPNQDQSLAGIAELQQRLAPTARRRLVALLGALGSGVALTIVAFPPSGRVTLLSLLSLPLFTLTLVSCVRRVFSNAPLIEWSEDGLTDRSGLISDELFIPWEDVDHVRCVPSLGTVQVNLIANAQPESRIRIPRRRRAGTS